MFVAVLLRLIDRLKRLSLVMQQGAWRVMPYIIIGLVYWTIDRVMSFMPLSIAGIQARINTMLQNILLAALLMAITTAIHAGFMLLCLKPVLHPMFIQRRIHPNLLHVLQLSRVVLIMFLASIIEVMLWAFTYLHLGAIEGFETAVYFSMVTFTTLGYGDIVLHEGWRLLASFEAINGIIMGGWTTAIVMWAVTREYFNDPAKDPGR